MNMLDLNELAQPAEDIAADAKTIFEQEKDKFLLTLARTLSVAMARFLTTILIVLVFVGTMVALSFGGTLLLGEIIGNYFLGAAIVALAWVVLLVLLLMCRKRLFVNSFVKLFISSFYGSR